MIYYKNYHLFVTLIFLSVCSYGQRFNSINNYVSLPDFAGDENTPLEIPIYVQGIEKETGKNFGLEKVQLAIVHSRISDIKVELVSPEGTVVWITNRHGRDGANYTETIFSNAGFRGRISDGTPPFLGEYLPDGRLANFNDGQDPNGIWVLKVYDLEKDVSGKFGSVVLIFSKNPAIDIFSKCQIGNAKGCKCQRGQKELLPDLTLIKSVTEKEIFEVPYDSILGYGEIKFGVSTMNIGYGPLEVQGDNVWRCGDSIVSKESRCLDGSYPRQKVYQHIYRVKRGKFTKRLKEAGTNAYDARPGHEHYHSDNYVDYELFKYDSFSKKMHLVCQGTKASFCIWDLGFCRSDSGDCVGLNGNFYGPRNLTNYGFKGYNECSSDIQGLSVGGVDYYGESFEGQNIIIPEQLKNGNYFLRVIIDPKNLFEESNEENNEFIIPIKLEKQQP